MKIDIAVKAILFNKKHNRILLVQRGKKDSVGANDWESAGGGIEWGEHPEEAMKREIKEETGLTVKNLKYRGIVTFVSNIYGTEYMHLFTANDFEGEIDYNCDEGKLEWVKKEDIPSLPIWEGDKIFFDLLENESEFFSLKLCYEEDRLVNHVIEK